MRIVRTEIGIVYLDDDHVVRTENGKKEPLLPARPATARSQNLSGGTSGWREVSAVRPERLKRRDYPTCVSLFHPNDDVPSSRG